MYSILLYDVLKNDVKSNDEYGSSIIYSVLLLEEECRDYHVPTSSSLSRSTRPRAATFPVS